jgi:hypothetical protein
VSINTNKDKNAPSAPEAYYEKVASQEEIYLEETEEEVRTILTSDDQSFITEQSLSMTEENSYARIAESEDQQLDQAAEELITGDCDDPPLSDEAVAERLRVSLVTRRLGGRDL